MEELQQLIEDTLKKIPRLALEKRLAEKIRDAGLPVDEVKLSKVAEHILSGSRESFIIAGGGDTEIQITDEDLAYAVTVSERFYNEQLAGILDQVSDKAARQLRRFLDKRWPEEFAVHQADIGAFKERLEHRWGKALAKLRMLLAIVREWSQALYERRQAASSARLSHFDDVMLRLHVRACQVTSEIIILLENGYADGAMARWRTLHEITIVAAVIARFGEEIAERYVYYQIVESLSALKAYERDHQALGFKPPSPRQAAKVRKDHAKVLRRFGEKFGDDYGWAAHHLKTKEKERVTFARLEKEAGDAVMRSPYKMASYNVHASPKGVYFKLGSLKGSPVLLAGPSNAGLTEPAQNAAVSLAEITWLLIGDSSVFEDMLAAKIIALLEAEIPTEFFKADKKLQRDDRRNREAASKS
jgi:hypothetical protein